MATSAGHYTPRPIGTGKGEGLSGSTVSTVLQFVFSSTPLLAFRTDDEKKASHYHHNANDLFGFNLFLLALISSFAKK